MMRARPFYVSTIKVNILNEEDRSKMIYWYSEKARNHCTADSNIGNVQRYSIAKMVHI